MVAGDERLSCRGKHQTQFEVEHKLVTFQKHFDHSLGASRGLEFERDRANPGPLFPEPHVAFESRSSTLSPSFRLEAPLRVLCGGASGLA